MVRIRSAFGTTRIVACVVALAFGATTAFAQSASQQASPARFFRIQDVLNKISAGRTPGAEEPVRLAARSGDIMSDVPLRGSIPQIGEEPFGLFAFRAPEGILWRKWRGVEAEIAAGDTAIARCRDGDDCAPGARRYLAILDAVKAREGRARLEEVNRQINATIRYVGDMAQHGMPDRWSAPLAALAGGKGDCEDYAIAKYVILREAGYPLADLRFLLVRDRIARDDHAVLAARLDGRWLILDNRFNTIPEDSRMHNFTPLFALDHDGVKLVAAPYAKRTPMANEPQPAALFDGEFSLRGALTPDTAAETAKADQNAGESEWIVAPLLM